MDVCVFRLSACFWFWHIKEWQGIFKVSHILEGIEEALRVGLKLVKVNVCVVRGLNHEEIVDIAKFFKGMDVVDEVK